MKERGDITPKKMADKDAIENAKQLGKLKFFPLAFDLRLDSDELFDEIFALVEFKKTLK